MRSTPSCSRSEWVAGPFEAIHGTSGSNPSRTQDAYLSVFMKPIHHRAFEPNLASATIQDDADLAVKISKDMICSCRAGLSGRVRTRSCQRSIRHSDQPSCDWVRGHSYGYGGVASGDARRDDCSIPRK
ncbi:hypothetical protein LshimejAT787_0106280 [Lyophyllum shimeji]|uniref:Uncharacterized protein n=1 Tax=Lyophyllum shimeji TaxID=47721 RepID=A0A9P3UHD7_LYOSH|nr:hypothetical protein LshimejAT787_0106280 [Lyophyllum shimeji]